MLSQKPCEKSISKMEWSSMANDAERLSEKGHGHILGFANMEDRVTSVSPPAKCIVLRIIDHREFISKTSSA